MHAALKLQCGRVTGNKKFTIGGLIIVQSMFSHGFSFLALSSHKRLMNIIINTGLTLLHVLKLSVIKV